MGKLKNALIVADEIARNAVEQSIHNRQIFDRIKPTITRRGKPVEKRQFRKHHCQIGSKAGQERPPNRIIQSA